MNTHREHLGIGAGSYRLAPNPNGTSIGSAIFAQMTAKCPYTLQ